MATRSPWASELFFRVIVAYLAFNLHRAIRQSQDGAEVAFWVVSYLLQYNLFRSIRLYALSPPAGSPERHRTSDSAVFLAVCVLALHAWKVLATWLVFAAILAGFFLLLSVRGEEVTDHARM